MITPLDNLIEAFLRHKLHAQRDSMILKASLRFKHRYPHASVEQQDSLYLRLKKEAIRVYDMSDDSILEASITKATYTFWFTTVFGTLFIGVLNSVTSGNYFPLISPIIMSLFNWLITVITIPVSYNQRIKGGMNSTISTFVEEEGLNIDENSALLNKNDHSSYYKMHSHQSFLTTQPSLVSPGFLEPLRHESSAFSMSLTTFLTKEKSSNHDDSKNGLTTAPNNATQSASYSPI